MATCTLTRSQNETSRRVKTSGMEPWYAPNKWIETREAVEKQARVLESIRPSASADSEQEQSRASKPDETELFAAMHTCAYRYTHAPAGSVARKKWLHRWKIVRDHIIESNLGLAYSMIARFNSAQADLDDVSSEAMYGLYRAVERYDPWKGYRFSTYACNCIARACMRQRKREQRRRDLTPVSFDTPWNLTDEEADEAAALRVERLKHVLQTNTAELSPLEKRVLDERFPAHEGEAKTFKEIARLIGLSKERVRQIQNIALDKLRTAMKEDRLLQ